MAEPFTRDTLVSEHASTILEHIHDAIIVTDPDGNVHFMNAAARSLYGFEEQNGEELESVNLQRYALDTFEVRTLGGEPVEDDDRPLVRALRGEDYHDVELLVEREDAEYPRVFVYSGSRVEDDPYLGVLTIRDETDRWRNERRYRVAFETDPAPGVVARLADAEIMQANDGMVEMTELERDELTGRTLVDLKLLRYNGDLKEALDALRNGERIHKVKTELKGNGETNLDVLLSARAIELDGQPCGILTFVEISDLERTKREHETAQRELARARTRLAEQRELERVRLARELHDGVLQDLLALSTEAGFEARRHRQAGHELAADANRRCRERALSGAVKLRRTIRGFRPAALQELGLWASLRETIPDIRKPDDPEVTLPDAESPDLPEKTLHVLYRVAQEAIHNALKHARASRVEVDLELRPGEVVLSVEDDGRGFEVPERLSILERGDHFGLIGMEERVQALNGRLEVASEPGEGTRISCRIPLGSTRLFSGGEAT